jgi:hypothetical protein
MYAKTVRLLLPLLIVPASGAIEERFVPGMRLHRELAFSSEIGANSLGSPFGFKATYFIQPRIALDVGVGVSGLASSVGDVKVSGMTPGVRPGIYARYLLRPTKMSPFVYGGAKYATGSGTLTLDNGGDGRNQVKIHPAPFADFGVGFDYMAHNGYYMTGGFGWSYRLGGKSHEWTPSSLSPIPQEEKDAISVLFGSGPALFVSAGYAF